MRAIVVMICCGFLLGCSSTSSPATSTEPPFPAALYIDSRGGPPMIVKAGAVELARVACGAGAIVALGDPGVPPLPWSLSAVRQSNGTVLFTGTVTELPRWLVFFGSDGGLSSVAVAGPPGPTCTATTPPTSPSSAADHQPSATASDALDCGPLASDSCAMAIAAAESLLPATHEPLLTARIELPTVLMTCPPSGGPVGAHVCQLIVHLVTSTSDATVALVRTADGWVPSSLIR